MFIGFNQIKIHYTIEGKGNPLVLLHGFLESGTIWKELLSKLSDKRQVIAIDLPGHGRSGTTGEVHTMEMMAEAVHHVLTALNIEKADFIGHSMGGYVLLSFLEKHPNSVKKLVLLNSTPAQDTEERKAHRERSITVVKKNKKAFISMAINNLLTPENSRLFKEELDNLKAEAFKFPVEGIVACLRGMKIRTDKKILLKEYEGEKFLLAGTEDPLIPYKEVENIGKNTGCHVLRLQGGHLGFIESKKELYEFVYFIE